MRADLYNFHTSVATRAPDVHPYICHRATRPVNRGEAAGSPNSPQFCLSWNEGSCISPRATCRFRHACNIGGCGQLHRAGSTTTTPKVGTGADAHQNERTGVRSRDPKNNFPFIDSSSSLSSSFFLLNSVKLNFSPRGCLANSHINVDTLELQLLGHPDRSTVYYVLSCFREDFRIGFHPNCVKLKSASSNCPSSRDHVGVIDEYLTTTEIHAGRVVGPLKTPPFPYLQISRFGVIPKKNKVNAWRLILDQSFPLGHSVNDGIDKSEYPMRLLVLESNTEDKTNVSINMPNHDNQRELNAAEDCTQSGDDALNSNIQPQYRE